MGLAMVLGLLVALEAALPTLAGGPAHGGPLEATEIGTCVITHTRTIFPLEVPLGSRVKITTTVGAHCYDVRPLHVVLLVDASSAMSAANLDGLRSALIGGVQDLALEASSDRVKIGIVAIGGRAGSSGSTIVSYLSADGDRLVPALRGLRAEGDTCLTCGLADAIIVLKSGRAGAPADDLREVILLASAGVEQSGCDAVQTKAREVRAQSILLVTACAGAVCERRCLSEAASAPRYAFRTEEWSAIGTLLANLRDSDGPFHPLQSFHLVDQTADAWVLEAPADLMAGESVDVDMSPWPPGTVSFNYAARAAQCGVDPMSRRADVTVRFNDGHGEVLALDNPSVGVTCNLATGTPTPTATRGPSPSPTSGAQPTPTATGRPPHRAYLPAAVRSGCLPADSTTDLAILIDVSGSMAAPLPPYPSRWDAAQQAALDVIDALHAMDRVAVLAYADDVWAVQALTSDHEVARRQVARHLPKADGSRLDKGLGRALEELEAGGATAGRIVVFTDGDLNQTDRSSLQAPKEAIRASGVSLAVVLFGEAPDALWRQLAGPMRVWRYGAGTADAVARGARCFR